MDIPSRIKKTFVSSMDEKKYDPRPEASPYAKWIVGHPERQRVLPNFIPTFKGHPMTKGHASVEEAVQYLDKIRWKSYQNEPASDFAIQVYFGNDLADTLSYEEILKSL